MREDRERRSHRSEIVGYELWLYLSEHFRCGEIVNDIPHGVVVVLVRWMLRCLNGLYRY